MKQNKIALRQTVPVMKSSFSTLIADETPTTIGFLGTWCGPCRPVSPILEDPKFDLGDGVRIFKIDVDNNQKLASAYNVKSIPTIILKNGELKWRATSPPSKVKLNSIFEAMLFGIFFMIFHHSVAVAQSDSALLRDLAAENKKSVDALVLYPSETRLAILETTKYPEILIKMQDMREKTSEAYRSLIEDFPQATQAVFYDLNRYPGLVALLIQQKNDLVALRKVLEVLPEDKREASLGVVSWQMPTLVQINALDRTTHQAFEQLIAKYPAPARQAFTHLLDLPEVIDLLNEDLRFTILVGETYRDNPTWVIQKTDSLNLSVARAHADELEDWKKVIENDPDAKSELQSAARDYAAENGYNSEDYNGDDLYSDGNFPDRDDDIRVRHYYQPYPYWYGYPWWEPYPRWHPYPWWWEWGGYFGPHNVVIVYLPSYHFMHWYFGQPYHHHQYNHLSTHFVNHYYGHRHSGTTISTGVRDWHENNRSVISNDFIADKKQLPGRLKAYSQFEQERQAFNTRNPRTPATQEGFLDKNPRKYQDLQHSRTAAKAEIQQDAEVNRKKRADWAPAKSPVRDEPVPVPKTERPVRETPAPVQKQPRKEQPATREPAPTQRPRSRPDEAKDYNRQKWGEDKQPKATQPNQPATRPKIKNTPQKTEKSRGRG